MFFRLPSFEADMQTLTEISQRRQRQKEQQFAVLRGFLTDADQSSMPSAAESQASEPMRSTLPSAERLTSTELLDELLAAGRGRPPRLAARR